MTVFLLANVLLLALFALAYCLYRMHEMGQEVIGYEHSDHAKCIAHVAHYVGNRHAALVLLDAAQDFDINDPVQMPSVWLRARADSLLGVDDNVTEYNLAGEHVL